MQEGQSIFRKSPYRKRFAARVPAQQQTFFCCAAAAEEQRPLRQHRLEIAVPQGRVFLPQGDHPAVRLFQPVGAAKVHGAAVFVFRSALQTLFIAVEDAGHSGKAHLEQHRLFHPGAVAAAEGEKAADVVAVQQVQLGGQHLPGITGQQAAETQVKLRRVDGAFGEKLAAEAAEIVVHGSVHHPVIDEMRRVFPDLADD